MATKAKPKAKKGSAKTPIKPKKKAKPKAAPKPHKRRGAKPGSNNGKGKQYSNELMIAALKEKKGLISQAAELLGCSTVAIYKRIKEDLEVKQALADCRTAFVDMAEEKLFNAVRAGDIRAVFYTLSRLGKDRGYVERMESTGADGAPLNEKVDVANASPEQRRQFILAFLEAAIKANKKAGGNGSGALVPVQQVEADNDNGVPLPSTNGHNQGEP